MTLRDVGEYPHAVYIPPLGGEGPLLVLVPCKGDDKLYQYQLANETGALSPLPVIDLPPGTMPRHMGFVTLETGVSLAYLLGEASHELHTLVMDRSAGYALSPVTTGPPLDQVYVVPNEVSPMHHNVVSLDRLHAQIGAADLGPIHFRPERACRPVRSSRTRRRSSCIRARGSCLPPHGCLRTIAGLRPSQASWQSSLSISIPGSCKHRR